MFLRITTLSNTKNKVIGLFIHHWTVARTLEDEKDEDDIENEIRGASMSTKGQQSKSKQEKLLK